MQNPIVFHAEMMGGIIYFHQAIQQPDASELTKAVVKEVEEHICAKHWVLVKWEEVPLDTDVLPAIWAMRHKHNLMTNKIKGHKARLHIRSGKQVYSVNYFETYAPVVTWFAIHFMINIAISLSWAM